MRIGRTLYIATILMVLLYLVIPLVAVVASSFSESGLLNFPLQGGTLKWYHDISGTYLHAFYVSMIVASSTTAISVAIGVPAGLAISRGSNRVSRFLNGIVSIPLSVPRLITGVALLQFAEVLTTILGIPVARSINGIVLGYLSFGVPFVVRSVVAAHAEYDFAIEEAARNLGANAAKAFLTVTLPALMPGIVAGALFAFFTALDDVPIALFMGGGSSVTLPVQMFTSIQFSFGGHVMAVSALLVGLAVMSMVIIDKTVGMDRLFGVGGK